ncbi:Por secretion system C-terminal sorting domain-containing protein [Hymenobacter gelipurpurascens]|uniref:Por secretion system C-terminal sorting domain-containing protein n=1 Tax=Hymenobacter gelipurpurascens TaxID=89968 RepID=A0A212UE99_9BACT|nr:T9SS type A sorting domain-containing protein [Hymenobacter gelipurpurascens]SNC76567.1 Por secretion system C-terminal sorting domain-containing protein [Hymenobacter gelipurpurascens]
MKTHLRLLIILASWIGLGGPSVKAEGSKNLTPGTNTNALTAATNDRCGYLVHNSDQQSAQVDVSYGFLKPASWVSPVGVQFNPDYRLFIRLLPNEKLSYGIQRANDPNFTTSNYKDLVLTLRYGTGDGKIVKQNTLARNPTTTYLLGTNQAGVIDDYTQAAAGPLPATGGYQPLEYTNNTGTTQDFFIEFTQAGEYTDQGTQPGFNDLKTQDAAFNNGASATGNRVFSVYNLWDFTVTGTDNQTKNGRLFSKAWAFSSLAATNLLSSKFTLYPLVESRSTANSYYVKAIELAGLRPYAFFFVTNEFGSTAATGRTSVADRRKSQNGNTAYAQYPSFVNDPDPTIWRSASIPTASITPQPYCRNGNTEVAFTTSSTETGRFDINITYGGNTRTLNTDVVGGSSATIIWDGLVNGVRVPAGQTITYSFTNRGAPVNFPLYDAENNEGGFVVRNIRPSAAGADALYWDDTNITALGTSSLNGTLSPAHSWGNNDATTPGNAATVNTWTYGFVSAANSLTYITVNVCDNDGDNVPDNTDIDDDNDGILDLVEALSGTSSIDPSAFADATSPIRYLDVDYVHPIFGAFRDLNNNGVNDIFDTDGDGIPNHFDLDSDGDGLTDSFEAGNTNLTWVGSGGSAGTTSGYSVAQGRFTNTLGSLSTSVGNNGLPNAVENRTNNNTEVSTIRYTLTDSDGDTFTANNQTASNYNFLDLDSDNDGITDEIEALASATYATRKAQTNFNTDTDKDGIRDAYDGNVNGGNSITTRVDTDLDGVADMFDLDSDGDNATRTTQPIYKQTADWTEGFDANGSGAAGDEIVTLAQLFATNNPLKSNYYSITTNGAGYAATTLSAFLQDSDGDNIPNFLDIQSTYYHDDNFNGLVDIYDPAYSGTSSTAPGYTSALADAYFRRSAVAVPLPVQLASFMAKAVGQSAQLTWRTAQEQNNDYFVIERSFDGKSFSSVGQVKGQGTTSVATDYRFTDAQAGQQAQGQVAYYRLRQVDTDGTASYSSVQALTFSTTVAISVKPNPASGEASLELGTLPVGQYQVMVLDVTGRSVYQASAQGGQAKALPVGQWPAGVYLIRVQGQNTVQTTRLIKE